MFSLNTFFYLIYVFNKNFNCLLENLYQKFFEQDVIPRIRDSKMEE